MNGNNEKELIYACDIGDFAKVKALANRENINCEPEGWPPLHSSLAFCHPRVYNFIIDNFQANEDVVNKVSREFNTIPLHRAAASCDSDTVKKVADLTTNINQKASNGATPLDFAIRYNNVGAAIELLRDHSTSTKSVNKLSKLLIFSPQQILISFYLET